MKTLKGVGNINARIEGVEIVNNTLNYTEKKDLYHLMKYRRTSRKFSDIPIENDKLQRILQAGFYAPSGSNKSPYRIIVIRNPEIRKRIREQAENVEIEFYRKKRQENEHDFLEWTKKKNIKTNKPFLTEAPILISVCEDTTWSDRHSKESTWLTIAYMVLAIANEGLTTVTYTPEPQDFMVKILRLEDYYQSQVILPVGYPIKRIQREPNRPKFTERVQFVD